MEPNGEYVVLFKHPDDNTSNCHHYRFEGKCENFVTIGVCAFSNEKKEMLLVNYKDIVQMRLK